MQATLILAFSVLLQFVAAALALRLIRITGSRWAWTAIVVAVALMAVRRGITLTRILTDQGSLQPDLSAELVALLVSALMVAGLSAIGPLFRSIKRSEKAQQESRGRVRNSAGSIDTAFREAESRQTQKMPAIGILSDDAAHDFNNLMTAMCGYIELAKRHAVNGETAAALEKVERAAKQAVGVTRGVLAFGGNERSRKESHAARQVQQAPAARHGHGELVIVAEDDSQVRAVTASSLMAAGFEVLQACDGDEAMRLFRAHRDEIRLIVLDVDMPRKNGPACLTEIRATNAELPIIVSTGDVDFDLDGSCAEQAVLIRKPFRMSQLNELAHRALGGIGVGKEG